MSSDFLRGWKPKTPNAYARPVQDEDATNGPLCGAELPDTTGCLVWGNSSNVRYAHTPDTASWLVDDSVPSANMATAVATGGTIYGTTVFMADGGLYLLVSYLSSGGNNVIALYQANSATLPTSWSLVSTIWNQSVTGGGFGDPEGVGHPIILDSGRWVLATKATWSPDPSFHETNAKVFVSDNSGASWTNTYTYTHPYPGFARLQFAGSHIGTDPATGDLWFMSGTTISGPEHQIALHHSPDDGATWSIDHASGYPYTNPHPVPFLNNGTDLYAFDASYLVARTYLTGSPGFPDDTDWPSTGVTWTAPGVDTTGGEEFMRGIIAPLGRSVFFFVRDQVMRVKAGGWHTGYVGT